MVESLKHKTVSGVIWSAIERFSLQGVQFIINIIMARLLLPSDYGMISMLAIFLQISQAFVDCGFTDALIQKKNKTEADYSTVFYFNVVLSVFIYLLIFICAPLVGRFYHMPELNLILRVISINLVISSLCAIHKTRLTILVNFKLQSKISLFAAIISGIIGIIMAYTNWGVWSLVFQSILNTTLLTILYYSLSHWIPLKIFSIISLKSLFSFGYKLLISRFIHTIYRNVYTIVIGRRFSAIDLGYYSRAEQFAILPSSNLNVIISRVAFPILSTIQDDNQRLLNIYQKYIRISSYIIFPLMIGLVVLAKPLIEILLTNKWSEVIILLQILCFDWMFDHLSSINLNLLYVKGRSDLALKLEIIKKIIAILILLISLSGGLIGICIGRVLYSLIATYLNTYYTKKIIGLSFIDQMKDIIPYFLLSIAMGISIYWSIYFIGTNILQILIGLIVGIVFYFGLSLLFKIQILKEIFIFIK